MNTKTMNSLLDKEMKNYVHFGLCYLGANFIHHKLAKCVCYRCPFTHCKYRTERRRQTIHVQKERRK